MQALRVAKLPDGDWLYEVKLDGYRALAFKDSRDVRLISRNNKPLNYPQLLDSLKPLAVEQVILDGERQRLQTHGQELIYLRSSRLFSKAIHAPDNHTIRITRMISASKATPRLNIRTRRS